MSYTIALIPARKGSKRVPGKNIRLLQGKPLVQYSIEHALQAHWIDDIYVSTDDEAVAAIAGKFKCRVIDRPESLATDHASTLDVIKHCIDVLKKDGKRPDYIVLLQPTVPIRDARKIDEAIELLKKTGCDSVISHIRVDYFHPNRMKKIVEEKIVPYSEEEIENVSRDRLPAAYYRDGSIYAMKSSLPEMENTVFGKDIRPVINERSSFCNIDDERDWQLAEILMQSSMEKK